MKRSDFDVAEPITESTAVTGLRTLAPVGSVLGCCLLVSLGAQVRIPVPGTDVFMTLQPLAVLLTGFALSPRRAVAAMLLYLACGTAGLPVFAGSAGLAGPTGGYLVGFVVAAWLISALKGGHGAGFGRLLPVGAAGLLVIFASGIAWRAGLAFFLGLFGGEVWLAVSTGLIPFLAKSVVELLVAVTLVVSVRRPRSGRRLRRLRFRGV
ncbi:MAG: biotin transporter BioY [Phycisphaerales bacterium]|nr:MAG: biotin transporter BioY [Phycisphaerales bacterium]